MRQADQPKLDATDTFDRYADPEETSHAVAFLVPSLAAFISGRVPRVDRGARLWPV